MNLFFQLFMTFLQNGIKPRELLRELLVCCLGLKPAKDAWRVAAGVEMEEHHTFSHKLDLMITKGSEIFAESIPGAFRWVSARTKSHVISYPVSLAPGCILQVYAYTKLMKVGGSSKAAVASILISAFTTGFTSATISYVRPS